MWTCALPTAITLTPSEGIHFFSAWFQICHVPEMSSGSDALSRTIHRLLQLLALAHVPVAVARPHHVRHRGLLLVHRLAVHLLPRQHAELTHLVGVEVRHRRAEHLDRARADRRALDVVRVVERVAVAHPPDLLHELGRRRRVADAEPALALPQLVLLAEVPVAARVPQHPVVVAELSVDRAPFIWRPVSRMNSPSLSGLRLFGVSPATITVTAPPGCTSPRERRASAGRRPPASSP